jgi:hypothetical protein
MDSFCGRRAETAILRSMRALLSHAALGHWGSDGAGHSGPLIKGRFELRSSAQFSEPLRLLMGSLNRFRLSAYPLKSYSEDPFRTVDCPGAQMSEVLLANFQDSRIHPNLALAGH